MTRGFRIGKHTIGPGARSFIIAEAGVNHNGETDRAFALVDAAATAGADAVKFQTFQADSLVTAGAPKATYQAERTGASESQAAMLRRLELPKAAWARLSRHCRDRGILFLSTPFDIDSAYDLHELGVPAMKLPSGELTNLQFIATVARLGRPIILSTGMGTLAEVSDAVEVIRAAGNPPLALLHCVSDYPTAPEDANLRAMETLHAQFQVPVGWSDHTTGIDISLAAVALGASVIEKHFTLDKTLAGPDHAASLDPTELGSLVASIRRVEAAFGNGTKTPKASESACAASSRRSLVPVRDLEIDDVLTADDLVAKRPGTGIPPSALTEVVGLRLRRPVTVDTPLTWDHIEVTAYPISSLISIPSAPSPADPPSATP